MCQCSSKMANFTAGMLLVTYLFLTTDGAQMKLKKYIWLDDIKSCPGKQFNNSIAGYLRHAGNGTFNINLDLKCNNIMRSLFFHVTLKKCPTRLLTSDCEPMMSFPLGNQCNTEDAYFRNMYSQFNPKIECPLQKGNYIGRDIVLDPERYYTFFRGLEDDEWLYVMIKISSDRKLASTELCMAMNAAIKKMRVRQ